MDDTELARIVESNRRSWNVATEAHNAHKADQAGFLRRGGSTLFPEERQLLGDVAGKRLLHLQCNAGQDTLSLANLGAEATGVDLSDAAITFARRLSAESGVPAAFEQGEVLAWLAAAARAGRRFDVVFCSYGAVCWVPDLRRWAEGIAAVLVPGGRFACIEFHPFASVLGEDWRPAFPYWRSDGPLRWDQGVSDYVGRSGAALAPSGFVPVESAFENPHPVYEFSWPVSDIVQALLDAGLRLTRLVEYPWSNGCRILEDMREMDGRRLVPPEGMPSLPLMVGLTAVRDAGDAR